MVKLFKPKEEQQKVAQLKVGQYGEDIILSLVDNDGNWLQGVVKIGSDGLTLAKHIHAVKGYSLPFEVDSMGCIVVNREL